MTFFSLPTRRISLRAACYRLSFSIALLSPTQAAFAQRGLIPPEQESRLQTPSRGVPGFFDSIVPEKNTLVFDFPTFGLDLGLTQNLSAGINVFSAITTIGWIAQGANQSPPFLWGKIRYRLFSVDGWSATTTTYLGSVYGKTLPDAFQVTADQKINAEKKDNFFLATLNASRAYTGGLWGVSLAAALITESSGDEDSKSRSSIRRDAKMISFWWRPQFTDTLESEFLVASCFFNERLNISNFERVDIDDKCFGRGPADILLRSLFTWRSSSHWLWSPGFIFMPAGQAKIIPVLNFNYLTSVFTNEAQENEASKNASPIKNHSITLRKPYAYR